ncbi:F-box only protein 27 isoform X8 [Callithrix jacchus]
MQGHSRAWRGDHERLCLQVPGRPGPRAGAGTRRGTGPEPNAPGAASGGAESRPPAHAAGALPPSVPGLARPGGQPGPVAADLGPGPQRHRPRATAARPQLPVCLPQRQALPAGPLLRAQTHWTQPYSQPLRPSWCRKKQVLDLEEEGLWPELLDSGRIEICVSDWWGARHDSGCRYRLLVQLLDANQTVLDKFSAVPDPIPQWNNNVCLHVTHVFSNIKMGIRFVSFEHWGQDTQFWAGHYGARLTNSSVMVQVRPP